MCRCRSGAVSGVELFAPATSGISNEIPIENLKWNSRGRRSKQFDSAHHDAPATAMAFYMDPGMEAFVLNMPTHSMLYLYVVNMMIQHIL